MRRFNLVLASTLALGLSGATVSAQDERPEAAPGAAPRASQEGRKAGMAHEVDRQAAVAHALCMAIEGSSLWCESQKAANANDAARVANSPDFAALAKHAKGSFKGEQRALPTGDREQEVRGQRRADRRRGLRGVLSRRQRLRQGP